MTVFFLIGVVLIELVQSIRGELRLRGLEARSGKASDDALRSWRNVLEVA